MLSLSSGGNKHDRIRRTNWLRQIIFGTITILFSAPALSQQSVEQWKRFDVSLANSSWSGNPFDIVLTADFTHVDTGSVKTQFGFYAGNDTWKIYFMPDNTGSWAYATTSADSDLNNLSGSFQATTPSISGQIKPSDKLWRLSSGEVISPTILAVGPYVRESSISESQDLVDWASSVAGATYLGTTLLNFSGDDPYTESQEDRMYIDGSGEGVDFYLPAWDRSNEFYDAVRDANMGHYILVYSDDGSNPNNHGLPEGSGGSITNAELRLFRYLVARFAPYPKVIWDSGIDIGETRSDNWIDNFVAWFQANDPWGHPISSRNGGGSGGIHPSSADYFSDGKRSLPSRSELISDVEDRNVATAMTDRYRENYSSPFDGGRDLVREAMWQMVLTYGTTVYFGGSDNGGYLGSTFASDLEAAPDLGVARQFLDEQMIDLGSLTPNDSAVTSGDAWVSTGNAGESVAYSRSGSSFTLSLDLGGNDADSYWYDPVSGDVTTAQTLSGQGPFVFSKPGNNAVGDNDWVLHIVPEGNLARPNAPTDLVAE